MIELVLGAADDQATNWPLMICVLIAIGTGIICIATGLGLEGKTFLSLRLLGLMLFTCFFGFSAVFRHAVLGEEEEGANWLSILIATFFVVLGLLGFLVIYGGIVRLGKKVVSRFVSHQEADDKETSSPA